MRKGKSKGRHGLVVDSDADVTVRPPEKDNDDYESSRHMRLKAFRDAVAKHPPRVVDARAIEMEFGTDFDDTDDYDPLEILIDPMHPRCSKRHLPRCQNINDKPNILQRGTSMAGRWD